MNKKQIIDIVESDLQIAQAKEELVELEYHDARQKNSMHLISKLHNYNNAIGYTNGVLQVLETLKSIKNWS